MWKLGVAIGASFFVLACGGGEEKAPEETGSPASAPATATTGKIACGDIGGDGPVYVGAKLVSADGSELERLSQKGINGFPSWSPDGTKLAVAQYESASLVVLGLDGTAPRELVSTAPDGIADAHWSPDGSRIAFGRFNDSGLSAIHVVNVDGTSEKKLADGRFAAWLPDGTAILYTPQVSTPKGVDLRDQPLPLLAAAVTGDQEPQKLIDIPRQRWEFAVSPDGTQIAYIASVGEMRTLPGGVIADPLRGLFLLDTEGQGEPREVLPPGLLDPHPLSFSPDGSRLAFVEIEESSPNDVTRYLAVVNTDDSGKRHLTSDIPYAVNYAFWSPDGRQIAFDAFVVDADQSEQELSQPLPCFGPWQPVASP